MPFEAFNFKQFGVSHDRCARKVSTDTVILGAWAAINHLPKSILDIGAGSGIISRWPNTATQILLMALKLTLRPLNNVSQILRHRHGRIGCFVTIVVWVNLQQKYKPSMNLLFLILLFTQPTVRE